MRHWAARLLLFVASFVVACAIGEVLVRMTQPRIGALETLFMEYDELLGWRKIPNGVGRLVTPEYDVLETFNSKGLRGPERDYDKRSTTRVVVLGDSFAEGYTVALESLLTTVLEHNLNTNRDRSFEVINAGTAGYSTDQELLFFTSEGKKYQPDFTVLLFYDNDVRYNARDRYSRGAKPFFVFDGRGHLKLLNHPVPRSSPGDRDTSTGATGFLRNHSQLYLYTREVLRRTPGLHRFLVRAGLMSHLPADSEESILEPPRDLIPDEFRIYMPKELPDVSEYAWSMTAALLDELQRETSAANSRLLVFYVPPRFVISDAARRAFRRQYEDLLDPERSARDLERICSEKGIEFLNPIAEMRSEDARLRTEGKSLYFKIDRHWTAEGHRMAAEMLERWIRSRLISGRQRGR